MDLETVPVQNEEGEKNEGMDRGYLLIDRHGDNDYVGFFPKETFDAVFVAPADPHRDYHVTFRPNSPHQHRLDSFLCNHEFYHAKSLWWPDSQFVCLGTFGLRVDAFFNPQQ